MDVRSRKIRSLSGAAVAVRYAVLVFGCLVSAFGQAFTPHQGFHPGLQAHPELHTADYIQALHAEFPALLSQNDRSRARSASGGLSLGEAVAIAKRRHGGEVLSARKQRDSKGNAVYVIKILTRGGVVKKVRIRAGN